jgi:hypothetical protein
MQIQTKALNGGVLNQIGKRFLKQNSNVFEK